MPSRGPAGDIRIDMDAECIWRDGACLRVSPKAFLVLRRLMQCPHQLVTKEQLLESVWPETYVVDRVLTNAVSQLREALDDQSKPPRFIETIHRRGYRWIAKNSAECLVLSAESDPKLSTQESLSTDFVGRQETLAELARCHARAAAGRRQVVFVSGDVGVGKTSVVDQFLMSLTVPSSRPSESGGDAPGLLIARGQCVEAYGAAEPYRPILEALEGLLRTGGADVHKLFAKYAPSWLLQVPELATPAEREELRRNVSASTSEHMQREFERAIEAVSADKTVVLLLEDLHWSDATTLSLLGALAARREPARLLVLGTYRPVDAIVAQHPISRLKHELGSKRQCVELILDGLDSDAVGALLDRRFGKHELPETFVSRLQVHTSGNPLFLLNALDDFEQRGWLREVDGVWTCTVDPVVLGATVPDGTRDIVTHRLDQLPTATQELLETASTIGVTFTTQALAAASERDCGDVEAECEKLARRGLFIQSGDEITWPDGTRGRQYKFRHALYQKVLSARVNPTQRQRMHRRIAERMDRGYGDQVGEIAGLLSFHYEHAGDIFRAVDFIEMLVRRAYSRCATQEIEALQSHAIALLKNAPQTEAQQQRLLLTHIQYAWALGGARGLNSDDSAREFEAARTLARSMPISSDRIAALGGLAAAFLMSGRIRDARTVGEELLVRADDDAPASVVLSASMSIGSAALYLGEIDAALVHLQAAVTRGAEIAPPGTHAAEPSPAFYDPVIPALTTFGLARVLAGSAERGWLSVLSGVDRARSTGVASYLGFALSAASTTAIIRGDLVEAKRHAIEFLSLAQSLDFPLLLELSRVLHGWVEAIETRDPARVDALRQAAVEYRHLGSLGNPRVFSLVCGACLNIGEIEEASTALDQAFDLRGEECIFDAELLRQRAAILVARGRGARSRTLQHSHPSSDVVEEADLFLERAIEAADVQGARLFGLRATVDLFRLHHRTDKQDEARQRLARALGSFQEGFDEVDLRNARAALDGERG